MFDTVAFNRVVEEGVSSEELADCIEVYTTHIQRDEIHKTPDPEKRSKLNQVFLDLVSGTTPSDGGSFISTESAVWDKSKWNAAKWTKRDNLYSPIKRDLDKRKKKKNNVEDALIAETAIKNGLTLVTNDENLRVVAMQYGGECMYFEHLFQLFSRMTP